MNPPSVTACRCAKSSTGRTQPKRARDREDVVCGPELAHAAHDLDAERHGPVLLLQPLAQLAELLDDRIDRSLALTAEQEAGVEDDDLGAGALRDAGRVVEHPDRHVELLAALRVPHEAGDRGVDREHDPRVACKLAEPLRPRVVHPELAFEVDLAGREAPFLEQFNRLFGTLARGHPGRTKVKLAHPVRVTRFASAGACYSQGSPAQLFGRPGSHLGNGA